MAIRPNCLFNSLTVFDKEYILGQICSEFIFFPNLKNCFPEKINIQIINITFEKYFNLSLSKLILKDNGSNIKDVIRKEYPYLNNGNFKKNKPRPINDINNK